MDRSQSSGATALFPVGNDCQRFRSPGATVWRADSSRLQREKRTAYGAFIDMGKLTEPEAIVERPREEKRSLVGSPGAFGAMSDSGEGDGRGELSGRRRESLLGVGEKKRSTRRAKMPHGTKIRSKRLIG
jgi:hypothetical protein